jgi:CRISPR/Cas system-associated exonuclease Cas4 (RecB family)
MAEVGKLSASKITTYKGCSLSYYLRYVQHEKVPSNVRLVFGKGVHYMLEKFYKTNYKSAESFSKYWKYYWMSDVAGDFLKGKEKKNLKVQEFKLKDDFIVKIGSHVDLGPEPVGVMFGYMKLGEGILSRFYNRHIIEKRENKNGRKPPIFIEKSFGVKKDEPFDIDGHLVRGVFDRIDESENGGYITDYKTDKSSPGRDSFTLHRHPQFTIYSYAYRKLYGKEEKAILYYHLRSGEIFKTHRSEKDYDYIKKLLDEVSDGISRDNFVPFYGFHCNMCDLKTACEKYSIPHHGGPRIDLEGKIKGAEQFTNWDVEIPDWMEDQIEER